MTCGAKSEPPSMALRPTAMHPNHSFAHGAKVGSRPRPDARPDSSKGREAGPMASFTSSGRWASTPPVDQAPAENPKGILDDARPRSSVRLGFAALSVALPIVAFLQAAGGQLLLACLGLVISAILWTLTWRVALNDTKSRAFRSLCRLTSLAVALWTAVNSATYALYCAAWVLPYVALCLLFVEGGAIQANTRERHLHSIGFLVALAVPMVRHSLSDAAAAASIVAVCAYVAHVGALQLQLKAAEARLKQTWIDAIMRDRALGFIEWREGEIEYSDALLSAVLADREERTLTATWERFIRPEDVPLVAKHMRKELGGSRPPNSVQEINAVECRMQRNAAGDMFHVRITGLVESDSRGNAQRALIAVLDQSDAKVAELRIQSELRRLREQGRELHAKYEALRSGAMQREDVDRIARHDLKTPASSIAAIPAILRQRMRFMPNEEALLGMIEDGAQRILHMLELSADIYRMEQGTFVFEASCMDLEDLARNCAKVMRIHADSKQVCIRVEAAGQPVLAAADPLLCRSIVENLLLNAVEAAPDGTEIIIAMYSGRRVGIAIHNQGTVPLQVRDSFFEKYVTHGKRGGLGLGTYSARLMARAQEGDIEMFTHEEHGTTLTLKLKRYALVPSHEAQDSIPAPWFDHGMVPHSVDQTLQILLAEDDADSALIIASWIPPKFRVVQAVNGRAAVVSAQRRRPDLILMDLEMPIMGGLEAISLIRKGQRERSELRSIIVALSANGDPHTRRSAQAAGSDMFLVKPLTKARLEATLDLCFGSWREPDGSPASKA